MSGKSSKKQKQKKKHSERVRVVYVLSKGGLGMCEPNGFYLIWEFLCSGLTEKALFQEILGLLLVYADWEKGGVHLRVCIACV